MIDCPSFSSTCCTKQNKTTQEKNFCLLTEQSAAAQSFENRLPVFPKVSSLTFAQRMPNLSLSENSVGDWKRQPPEILPYAAAAAAASRS
jgi:hypothetical protein